MPGRLDRRYLPLLDALDALPAAEPRLCLSFAELEALLGHPLPESAHVPSFWTGSAVAQRNWERSGFTARLDRVGPAVTFTRLPPS
jgi:hypothetical protein